MKPTRILSFALTLFLLSFSLFSSVASAIQPTTHVITFSANSYNPASMTVEVGDTIIWKGDFTTFPLVSTSVPTGVLPIGPISSGTSFLYVVEVEGTYDYQNNVYASLGMKGTFTAVFKPHGSLTNEGKEFFLGMLYPTYNNVAPSSIYRQYATYALVTSYYDNVINYSYYDASGHELTPTKRVIGAHQLLQISLDPTFMRVDSFAEQPVFRSCHITSKNPIAVQFLSRGANSGGSYLALPVLGLGKKYVVASYYDDGGGAGALYNRNGLPKNYDVAGGDFMIIASDDITTVSITPSVKTSGGKAAQTPFTVNLSKGQSYFVRSDGTNSDADISGTLVQANKPIVVISGHEDANIGDVAGVATEARNLLIQQMVPVEYWDTVGYYSIPFTQSTASSSGDGYRVYTYDNKTAHVQADVQGVSGGYQFTPSQFYPAEKFDITTPVDIYSTNGQKISVMKYDERSQPAKSPYPAPSMETIIPHSRWRTAYNFSEFDPSGLSGVNGNQYVGIIADSLVTIKISADGSAESNLPSNGFTNLNTYSSVSNTYTGKGQSYDVASHSYYLHSDFPFICYTFGMSQITLNVGFGSNYVFNSEYSAPAGTQLNTGISPSFKVVTTNLGNCGGWNVCITDTSTDNPGIKAVALVDDTDGVYYKKPGTKFKNVSFDSSSADFKSGELHPDQSTGPQYCFKVNIDDRLAEAVAPIGVIDRNGNGLLIHLYKSAPTVKLSTSPIVSPKPDSIFFPQQTVGTQICTTFVVKNTAPAGGSPLTFSSAILSHNSQVFSIQSMTPPLPAQINAQDSLTLQLCYTSKDLLTHNDTLLITNDCFDIPISLSAHSATGLITADDITNYPDIDTGKEECKTLTIHNIGSASYNLLASPKLTDNTDFAIDPAFLASLPKVMAPGAKVSVSVCFHPKQPGSYQDTIFWATDIDASFANSGKNYSVLEGSGLKVDFVSVHPGDGITNYLSVRPNPALGSSVMVSFALPAKHKARLAIFDVLGRQLAYMDFASGTSDFELPIGFLQQGMYYVRLISDDIVLTQKLEVMH